MKFFLILCFSLPFMGMAWATPQNHVSQIFDADQEDCNRIENASRAKLATFISANQLNRADFSLEVVFQHGQPVYNPTDPIGRGPGDQTVDPPQGPSTCEVTMGSKNPHWGFTEESSQKFKGRNRLHACGTYMSQVQTEAIVVDAYNSDGLFGYCEISLIKIVKM